MGARKSAQGRLLERTNNKGSRMLLSGRALFMGCKEEPANNIILNIKLKPEKLEKLKQEKHGEKQQQRCNKFLKTIRLLLFERS